MYKCEYFLNRADECTKKAIEFAMKNEPLVAAFWFNASKGFKIKAYSMTIKEGAEVCR